MTLDESKALLGVYGVSFEYGGGAVKVVDEVNLEVFRGDFIAVIGPNGSGKSTLLKLMSGLLQPSEGQVRYQNSELSSLPPSRRAQSIAYVGPDLKVDFPLRALDAVLMGRFSQPARSLFASNSRRDLDAAQAAMERCQCWALRFRDVNRLSDGEKQLVSLARALVQGAKILLLDEALSRMDLHHQSHIGGLLERLARDEGYSIVLVSHDLNLATEWARRCVILKSGKVVAQGPLEQTLTLERARQIYPNADLLITPHPQSGVPKVFFSHVKSQK